MKKDAIMLFLTLAMVCAILWFGVVRVIQKAFSTESPKPNLETQRMYSDQKQKMRDLERQREDLQRTQEDRIRDMQRMQKQRMRDLQQQQRDMMR